ncbi:MAG: cobalt transporter CbiM [Rhodospirillum sp.]|nr:cobalt transporter CbiM [Rhodospirillum sp.]MCF8490484.1 cobalt transporter CbiM [Rhodospirillum sp.]MCF8500090.1 cobalt transporter CbiM [Rhodospirillum sp.]
MHIADGILPLSVVVPVTALAVVGVAWGLRDLKEDRLPAAALVAAALFVAGMVHVPLGPSSAHLVLNGLGGLILGWAIFPVMLLSLALQAAFFGFGGLGVLGVNCLVMAAPGVVAWVAYRLLAPRLGAQATAGLCCGGAVGLSALMVALVLTLSGGEFRAAAIMALLGNLPILVLETLVGAAVVGLIGKVRPDLLPRPMGAPA